MGSCTPREKVVSRPLSVRLTCYPNIGECEPTLTSLHPLHADTRRATAGLPQAACDALAGRGTTWLLKRTYRQRANNLLARRHEGHDCQGLMATADRGGGQGPALHDLRADLRVVSRGTASQELPEASRQAVK
jgi:hypothetical protein